MTPRVSWSSLSWSARTLRSAQALAPLYGAVVSVPGDYELAVAPEVPWRVVLLARGGVQLPPGQLLELPGLAVESGVADVLLLTRYEDVGLAEPLPRELVLEVHCRARDAPHAVEQSAALAGELAVLLAFVVNAHVAVPVSQVAFEAAPGLDRRQFWQAYVELESGLPHLTRLLEARLLFPFLKAVLTAPQRPRLARAIGQYVVALSHWTVPTRPLAMAHLYIALEALAPAVERLERTAWAYPTSARTPSAEALTSAATTGWMSCWAGCAGT